MHAKKGVVSWDPVEKVGKSNCRFEPRQTEKIMTVVSIHQV